MIEIVRTKAERAKQPWHVRVRADGNAEPLLAGETLVDAETAGEAVAALGRLFSPVHKAEYSAGVLTVWLDDDDLGEKLHVPVEVVDERLQVEPEPEPEAPADVAEKPKRTRKKAAS